MTSHNHTLLFRNSCYLLTNPSSKGNKNAISFCPALIHCRISIGIEQRLQARCNGVSHRNHIGWVMPDMGIFCRVVRDSNISNLYNGARRSDLVQRRSEVVPVQKHNFCFRKILAISWAQCHGVRICARLDQANHFCLISHQSAREIAKNPIGSNHGGSCRISCRKQDACKR